MNVTDETLAALEIAIQARQGRAEGNEVRFLCPSHDDQHPSARWNSEKQTWYCDVCKTGGGYKHLAGLLGLSIPAASNGTGQPAREIVETYDYKDEQGTLLYQVVRYHPKGFRQRRPDGKGGYIWDLKGVRNVLYRLPELAGQSIVYVPEGEKDVDRLRGLGLSATCNSGGALKWTDDHTQQLKAAGVSKVIALPDNDEPGQQHAKSVASSCCAAGLVAKIVPLPNLPLKGDVCDFLDAGGTVEHLRALVDAARLANAPLDDSGASSVGSFAPVPLDQLLDEPESIEPEWVVEDLLAAGSLAAIVSKPKVGKSTLIYELAVAVAKGRPFLGRATKQGRVLILAMEEHPRDVKRRLRNLGADQCEAIRVHSGPLTDAPDILHDVQTYIEQHQIVLVIFDTLNTYWSVSEENDAGAVTRALKPLLQLARGTGAAVLLLHHARKAEGEFGDEIRGSGAIFSLLDVALSLKRHDVETQRRLVINSRYAEAPPELLLGFRENRYESLGDPAAASKAAKLAKLAVALTDTPTEAKTIALKAGLSAKAAYPLLNLLVDRHNASRTGTGKKGDPFMFAKCVSFPVPKSGGLEETNLGPCTGRHETNPHDGFDASYPSTIGVGKEKHFTDSFLPSHVPPGRNELKEVDLVD